MNYTLQKTSPYPTCKVSAGKERGYVSFQEGVSLWAPKTHGKNPGGEDPGGRILRIPNIWDPAIPVPRRDTSRHSHVLGRQLDEVPRHFLPGDSAVRLVSDSCFEK